MNLRKLSFAFCLLPFASCLSARTFHVPGGDPGAWPAIFQAAGFSPRVIGSSGIYVLRNGGKHEAALWKERVARGAFLVLEGESALAAEFGFRTTGQRVRVASVRDERRPTLDIVWEHPLELPVVETPVVARIFTRERWTGAPLVVGYQSGEGAVLWVAVSPGQQGYERFPHLLHALADLGLDPPFRSRRLWAFFDSSYRLRADVDYLAGRWKAAGIAALHVAAWHYYEGDAEQDAYLHGLIETCHRNGILVYAWLELPHVSEKFWNDHPGWREKTAVLQDAHLDWRKLMNLSNRECRQAAAEGIRRLVERFDWDGVNLAELYFESLQGHENPSRFTPMNDDARREFRARSGFDPLDLFSPVSPRHYSKNEPGLRSFLDFRADLSLRIQAEWIAELETLRRRKPDLDLVLTHVDDRFDTRMRDAIGADAAGLLSMPGARTFTFLVEDPATVWNLGPDRYRRIAEKYAGLTDPGRLGIDINVVERYQDVYPTKQQTGMELLQLVHRAASSFARVALYFENSIATEDVPWLASAASAAERFKRTGAKLTVRSQHGTGIPWKGAARVNGQPWPVGDGEIIWLPPGAHIIEPAPDLPPMRLLDFNGDLRTAAVTGGGLEFAYESPTRAMAHLSAKPVRITIDGVDFEPRAFATEAGFMVRLPRGQHVVEIEAAGLLGGGSGLRGGDLAHRDLFAAGDAGYDNSVR